MSVHFTTPEARARRLIELYGLRDKVGTEIALIEAAIERETVALERAKNGAKVAGISIRKRPVAECGTDSGYYRHKRKFKEDACEPCKLAHRTAERRRLRLQRAAEIAEERAS